MSESDESHCSFISVSCIVVGKSRVDGQGAVASIKVGEACCICSQRLSKSGLKLHPSSARAVGTSMSNSSTPLPPALLRAGGTDLS